MKILVADDEKEIADLIEICLQNEGYEVLKDDDGSSSTTTWSPGTDD